MTLKEQETILRTIGNKSVETHNLMLKMTASSERISAGFQSGLEGMQTQIVKFCTLKGYLEDWITKIVDYCKEIMAMVHRNTRMLLQLHSMLAKLEIAISRNNINLPILEFENPFGVRMALPFQLCETWEVSLLCSWISRDLISKGTSPTTPCHVCRQTRFENGRKWSLHHHICSNQQDYRA